jgi:hypothetical protein
LFFQKMQKFSKFVIFLYFLIFFGIIIFRRESKN